MGRGGAMGFVEVAAPPPRMAAVSGGGGVDREDQWRSFDNSVNAVSFGFVATAILIAMFLVMAIFERFLRPRSSDSATAGGGDGIDGSGANLRKLDYPSPKMSVYPKGVSVLMPGERMPTFIAHPAPAPCPPERAYTSL